MDWKSQVGVHTTQTATRPDPVPLGECYCFHSRGVRGWWGCFHRCSCPLLDMIASPNKGAAPFRYPPYRFQANRHGGSGNSACHLTCCSFCFLGPAVRGMQQICLCQVSTPNVADLSLSPARKPNVCWQLPFGHTYEFLITFFMYGFASYLKRPY